MEIAGEWSPFSDGITRPIIRAGVESFGGKIVLENFLIDSGADRTVFSAAGAARLNLPLTSPPTGDDLQGISGNSPFALFDTLLEFYRTDGGTIRMKAQFAAFTDPLASDYSILGRDVLDYFDVILSRKRDQVLLLAANHTYQVVRV